ncbi:NADH-cytochrome b5 reductase 2 [Reticulomyxa filosa]|uniref:NADH-cytochrome b5 reductase 2 n=1 Tax=Reticulomyxa filosa TaxID=46433 RepID=X6NI79_RETFI|nr:NADH-cytochrome b5 reductase 2 [Reticulomyxa filosa]|eukprot:ETO25618.1 NADH-cytochrome b5 reductase 2 [Reticulomyxa filosa]
MDDLTGRITYTAPGTIDLERPLSAEQQRLKVESPLGVIKFQKVGMIAGGTGITPMLQVINQILSDPNDETEIYLIFANRSVDDILLREELEELAEKHKRFHLFFILDKAPVGVEWKGGVGFVTEDLVKQIFPKPSDDLLVLECGPADTNFCRSDLKHSFEIKTKFFWGLVFLFQILQIQNLSLLQTTENFQTSLIKICFVFSFVNFQIDSLDLRKFFWDDHVTAYRLFINKSAKLKIMIQKYLKNYFVLFCSNSKITKKQNKNLDYKSN